MKKLLILLILFPLITIAQDSLDYSQLTKKEGRHLYDSELYLMKALRKKYAEEKAFYGYHTSDSVFLVLDGALKRRGGIAYYKSQRFTGQAINTIDLDQQVLGIYKDGKKSGNWVYWNNRGEKVKEEVWRNGGLIETNKPN